MSELLAVPKTNLIIIRGCIERALAHDFQDEWIEQLGASQRIDIASKTGEFFDADYCVDILLEREDLPATQRIVRLLRLANSRDAAVGLNFQPSLSHQNFHIDNPTIDNLVAVVHGADGGSFDYAPAAKTEDEAEASYMSVEVCAGDVLLQTQQKLMHRGRNTSNAPRVTAAFARIDHDPIDGFDR
jgi:hypothetical protein